MYKKQTLPRASHLMVFGSLNVTYENNRIINQIGIYVSIYKKQSQKIPDKLQDHLPVSYYSNLMMPLIRITLPVAGEDPINKLFTATFKKNTFSGLFFA